MSFIRNSVILRRVQSIAGRLQKNNVHLSFFSQVRSFGGGRIPSAPETPGAKDTEVPTLLNQGVGKNFQEAELESKGEKLFNMESVKGEFGTLDKPVQVDSSQPSRIVGCVGAGSREHELVFFELKADNKHMCSMCGQVFELNLTPEIRKQYEAWKEAHPTGSKISFDKFVADQQQQEAK